MPQCAALGPAALHKERRWRSGQSHLAVNQATSVCAGSNPARRTMKFLVINASPNKEGGTAKFVRAFTDAAQKIGETRVMNLHDGPPRFSKGAVSRTSDFTEYQKATLDCDALFIATPTYWFNVPAVLKAFLEEIDEIDKLIYEKPRALGIAVYAPQGGELGAAQALVLPLNHMNFALVECGYIFHRDIAKDDWAWEDIQNMPARMKRTLGL